MPRIRKEPQNHARDHRPYVRRPKTLQRLSPFKYTAFEDAEKQMRLLFLEPGNEEDQIICSLQTFALGTTPSYEAISYTWGDEHPLHPIEVNENSMFVRGNCHYALSQMRLGDTRRALWIVFETLVDLCAFGNSDSVCINQCDDIEKGHQVQKLASIFKGARSVLVSLGPAENDSNLVLSCAHSLHKFLLQEMSESRQTETSKASQSENINPFSRLSYDPKRNQAAALWIEGLADEKLDALVTAMKHLAKRPYWRRLWIVPELKLTTNAILHCGKAKTTFDQLHLIYVAIFSMWPSNHVIQQRTANHSHEYINVLSPLFNLHQRTFANKKLQTFERELLGLGDLKCSDPRDRVYALLSVSEWPRHLPPIVVDYRKTTPELAQEVMHCCRSFFTLRDLLLALEIDCYGEGRKIQPKSNSVNPAEQDCAGLPSAVLSGTCQCKCKRQKRHTFPLDCEILYYVQFGRAGRLEIDKETSTSRTDFWVDSVAVGKLPLACPSAVYVRHQDDNDELFALVPNITRPGDIITYLTYAAGIIHGLVLRKSHSGIYEVIGKVVFRNLDPKLDLCKASSGDNLSKERPVLPRLKLRFDTEDAMILGLQMISDERQFWKTGDHAKYRTLELRSRFSSYAVKAEHSDMPDICEHCGHIPPET